MAELFKNVERRVTGRKQKCADIWKKTTKTEEEKKKLSVTV